MTINDKEVRMAFRGIFTSGVMSSMNSFDYDIRSFFSSLDDNPHSIVSIGLEMEDDEVLIHGLFDYANFDEGIWDGWHYILSLENIPNSKIEKVIPYFHIQIPLHDELIKEFKMRVEMELL